MLEDPPECEEWTCDKLSRVHLRMPWGLVKSYCEACAERMLTFPDTERMSEEEYEAHEAADYVHRS